MYLQVDAAGADAAAVAGTRPRRDARRRSRIAATAWSASKSTARRGRDVRRDLARAVVTSGWGLLELRPMRMSLEDVFLSLTTEETAAAADDAETAAPEGEPPMSNILAIAHKELKSYFASPIAYIVIGFWSLLYGYFFVAILNFFVRQSMQMSQFGHAGPAGDEHQPAADSPAAAERADPDPVPAADGDDADLLGGEAVGHDRAAADLAAHRLPDHHGQVPRRDGAVRRDAGGHADPHRPAVRLRPARSGSRSSPPTSACCCSAAASSRSACSSRA